MNYNDLKNLEELWRSGALSDEEFEREKQRFFNQNSERQSINETPLLGLAENSYIALMHISQFGGVIVPGVGFIAPVILWILNKENNANVNSVGKHIINFMISMFIYYAISGVLCCLLIGIPMLIALGIFQVVFVILATIKAMNGENWKYPFTIEILK